MRSTGTAACSTSAGTDFAIFGPSDDRFAGSNDWGIRQPSQIFNFKRGRFAPDANTIFDLGSVSKEFTAGTGFVDYNGGPVDVDVGAAYSAFMASGRKDYGSIVEHFVKLPNEFVRNPAQYPPGSYYYYNNTDDLLLGMAVARVSRKTLSDFLQARIFGPLGMTATHQGHPPATSRSGISRVAAMFTGPGSGISPGSRVRAA